MEFAEAVLIAYLLVKASQHDRATIERKELEEQDFISMRISLKESV